MYQEELKMHDKTFTILILLTRRKEHPVADETGGIRKEGWEMEEKEMSAWQSSGESKEKGAVLLTWWEGCTLLSLLRIAVL